MIPRKQLEEIAAVVQGIPVWGCSKGSPSEDAGVRYGDIVLVVNGMRTTSIDDYLAARKLRTDGVELELLRDGKEITLYLVFRAASTTSIDELAEKVVEGRFLGMSTPLDADKGLPN
jgi:S1-C subfamily serine protease